MKPELNCEYPEPGEAGLTEKMVRLVIERMKPQKGRFRRAVHAKGTGCVRGVFTIRDDVPTEFRHGVFQQPGRSFQAIVRFSNAAETLDPDRVASARGMAIKLLAVSDNCNQDFLTVNHPVFPFATPAEYVKLFELRQRGIPCLKNAK